MKLKAIQVSVRLVSEKLNKSQANISRITLTIEYKSVFFAVSKHWDKYKCWFDL